MDIEEAKKIIDDFPSWGKIEEAKKIIDDFPSWGKIEEAKKIIEDFENLIEKMNILGGKKSGRIGKDIIENEQCIINLGLKNYLKMNKINKN